MTFFLTGLGRAERMRIGVLALILLTELVLIGLYPILDKSEARYTLVVWRMVTSGDWMMPTIDGVMPFWGKPPLGYWLAALSMEIFGTNEFAARLSGLLMNAAMTALVIDFGRRMRDLAFGLDAGVIFASMALVFSLSGQLLIDPVLALAVTVAMIAFWRVMHAPGRLAGYLVFVALAAGLMAKGLIALVFTGGACLAWVLVQGRFLDTFRRLPVVSGTLLMLALAAPWFVLAELRTPGFLDYYIVGEHFRRFLEPGWTGDLYGSGRKQPPGAIWVILLITALPWSGVVIGALAQRAKRGRLLARGVLADSLSDPWIRFLLAWMLTPLLFYSLTRNVLLYYTLPALPAAALLMAQAFRNLGDAGHRLTVPGWALLMPVVGMCLVGLTLARSGLPFVPTQKNIVARWQADKSPADKELVYLFDRPFSASFYSRDRALVTENSADLTANPGQRYFAVTEKMIHRLPAEILAGFTHVARLNGTLLLKRTEPAPSAALVKDR